MKCTNCGFEWQENTLRENFKSCPVCGNRLKNWEKSGNEEKIESLADALVAISRLKGESFLQKGKNLTAIMSDLCPKLKTERLQLQILDEIGIWHSLWRYRSSDLNSQKKVLKQSFQLLDSIGFQEDAAMKLLINAVKPLKYDDQILYGDRNDVFGLNKRNTAQEARRAREAVVPVAVNIEETQKLDLNHSTQIQTNLPQRYTRARLFEIEKRIEKWRNQQDFFTDQIVSFGFLRYEGENSFSMVYKSPHHNMYAEMFKGRIQNQVKELIESVIEEVIELVVLTEY